MQSHSCQMSHHACISFLLCALMKNPIKENSEACHKPMNVITFKSHPKQTSQRRDYFLEVKNVKTNFQYNMQLLWNCAMWGQGKLCGPTNLRKPRFLYQANFQTKDKPQARSMLLSNRVRMVLRMVSFCIVWSMNHNIHMTYLYCSTNDDKSLPLVNKIKTWPYTCPDFT